MPARCARRCPPKCGSNLNRLYLRLSPVTMDSIWVHHAGAPVPRGAGRHARPGRRDLFHPQPWRRLVLPGTGPPYRAGAADRAGCWMCISAAAATARRRPKYFDWLVLLKFCTAFEPYTKLYTASIRPQKIAEFLLFDAGISPFHPLFGRPRDRSAGARRAGRAAGAPRRGGAAGGTAEGGGGFRPDRRTDVRRHRRLPRRHHHGSASRSTRRCIASYITYGAETVLAD